MSYAKVLTCSALIPVVVLLVYVFSKDREKEPVGLLLKLLLAGAVCCIPAALLEYPMSWLVGTVFGGIQNAAKTTAGWNRAYYLYYFFYALLVPGLCEEGCKFLVLWKLTAHNREFDSSFDGIVYAVFVGLGFAALENIMYVFQGGFSTALLRAWTAVPGHMFDAVFMGYFYSLWRQNLVWRGRSGHNRWRPHAIVCPMLVHGLYDFFAFLEEDSTFFTIGFYVLLAVLYMICFRLIKTASVSDHRFY